MPNSTLFSLSRRIAAVFSVFAVLAIGGTAVFIRAQQTPKPVDHPPVPVPKLEGIVVLFNNKPEEVKANWRKNHSKDDATWKVEKGGMLARGGDIVTKQDFTDFQLHVEFKVPYMPNASGQGRGNSGVGLQGWYEIQVLDSYGIKEPGTGGCGALYNQFAPLVNASRPPEEWQTYDITFRAARMGEDGKIKEKPRVTVLLNGIVIHNNQEINGTTGITTDRPAGKPGPIYLQDHGNDVYYRNIWIRPLPENPSTAYEPK